ETKSAPDERGEKISSVFVPFVAFCEIRRCSLCLQPVKAVSSGRTTCKFDLPVVLESALEGQFRNDGGAGVDGESLAVIKSKRLTDCAEVSPLRPRLPTPLSPSRPCFAALRVFRRYVPPRIGRRYRASRRSGVPFRCPSH